MLYTCRKCICKCHMNSFATVHVHAVYIWLNCMVHALYESMKHITIHSEDKEVLPSRNLVLCNFSVAIPPKKDRLPQGYSFFTKWKNNCQIGSVLFQNKHFGLSTNLIYGVSYIENFVVWFLLWYKMQSKKSFLNVSLLHFQILGTQISIFNT